MVTVVSGVGLWLWWTAGPPPVKYTTMPVDRDPISAIVTATGTVNPVVSVPVGSLVSSKLAKILAVQAKTSRLGTNLLISILRATTVRVARGKLGSISLIVGGISIMNILLMPVTERTRWIGLRMAFWAKRYEYL